MSLGDIGYFVQVLRIQDVHPGSPDIFITRIRGWLFPGSGFASKNLSIFIPGSRILDPGSGFFPSRIRIPDPGVKNSTGSRSPESGSATLFLYT